MATIDREAGLSHQGLDAAQVRSRVEAGQINRVPEGPSRTTADIIRANVITRFNILLGVMLVIVLVVLRSPRDGLFGFVVISNALIGIIQELRAKRTLDRLELLAARPVRVMRSGKRVEIAHEDIVIDDVIELTSGDQLVVDGEVLAARGLEINESLLTGESDPIHKEPGDECLSGSFVSAGSGRYRATKVGADAYAVRLAQEAKRFTLVRSELREGINWFLALVSWAVGPMIILLVWSQMRSGQSFQVSLSGAVAAGVAMIPQGLVLLASIAFALGVIRLGRRNVLVQELPAIEGLARVDTVCFDKTGTLTEGNMAVQEVTPLGDIDPDAGLAALAAIEPDPNATLAAVAAAYPDDPKWQVLAAVPFSSARKWSGASFAGHDTWVMGAPDVLAPNDAEVAEIARAASEEGRRMLLVARTSASLSGDRLPDRLQPVALLGLGDQVRPDAAETLRYFADQGVAAKVISGDHPDTVAAVARQVGVVGADSVVDARALPEDPEHLAQIMEEATVFGRVTPHQKRAMVGALQSRGHVVAMTGDGVNDVLALKDSDIGIAVGNGAPASRSVAQLVLIDGRFATLPGVVGEGRRVISNVERVANLFIFGTMYAIGLALSVILSEDPFPFLARHLTLVGSLTVGIPAFFLALAPSARRVKEGFVGRVLKFAIPTGATATVATFSAYQLALSEGVTLEEARTTAVLVLAAIGFFALAIVSRPILPWKAGLIAGMVALLVVAMVSSASRQFFELDPPRTVVLLAGLGIVGLTGTAMLITLWSTGWIRQVPEILRDSAVRPTSWRELPSRITDLSGWRRSFPATTEMPTVSPRNDATRGVETKPENDPESPLGTIEWFDPDAEIPPSPTKRGE